MPRPKRQFGDVLAENRSRYMARQSAVGGVAGTAPLGDRPGTTTVPAISSWQGTAAGRARMFALIAFGIFTFVHIAAESRFAGE